MPPAVFTATHIRLFSYESVHVIVYIGEFFNFEDGFSHTDLSVNPGSIALGFYSGLYSYSGW